MQLITFIPLALFIVKVVQFIFSSFCKFSNQQIWLSCDNYPWCRHLRRRTDCVFSHFQFLPAVRFIWNYLWLVRNYTFYIYYISNIYVLFLGFCRYNYLFFISIFVFLIIINFPFIPNDFVCIEVLTSQSTIFSIMSGRIHPCINHYSVELMCIARHNTVPLMGIEFRTSRFGVRCSTTTPPRSPIPDDEF